MVYLFFLEFYSVNIIQLLYLYERLPNFLLVNTLRMVESLFKLSKALKVISSKSMVVSLFVAQTILNSLYVVQLFKAVQQVDVVKRDEMEREGQVEDEGAYAGWLFLHECYMMGDLGPV